MVSGAEEAIKEPSTHTPEEYHSRVHRLAVWYLLLFVVPLVGISLLIWQAQLLVSLAQHSNVETLTIAFFLIFFVYIATLSARGVLGAIRIVYYHLLARASRDHLTIERRKAAAVTGPSAIPPVAALNYVVEKEGQVGEAFRLSVADAAGDLGAVEINGAELIHHDALTNGSNSLLAFITHQITGVLAERGVRQQLNVITWKQIDDETTEQYLRTVEFARNLERHLGAEQLWPKITLTDNDCQAIERRLSAVCPALRDEAFLPDWEYEGEHKLPLIPEPLGLVSLTRTERRVDPVNSMGCAVLVVIVAVLVLGMLIVFPPWAPGI